jgi:hypothetical protein
LNASGNDTIDFYTSGTDDALLNQHAIIAQQLLHFLDRNPYLLSSHSDPRSSPTIVFLQHKNPEWRTHFPLGVDPASDPLAVNECTTALIIRFEGTHYEL